jgi:bifunctional non-homologous end joining protein LigD
LDKLLHPAHGFTKGEVINYYSRVARVLLPHTKDRPVTFIRYCRAAVPAVAGMSWKR